MDLVKEGNKKIIHNFLWKFLKKLKIIFKTNFLGDQDVLDLLKGDSALLDAAKKGNLSRVQKLLTPENINCRDSQGRNSTPLHLAAGYNNLEVAEFLLENGADVNAQDKGGLIPLHNASSYGHLDIAALLIRYLLDDFGSGSVCFDFHSTNVVQLSMSSKVA